ncbi:unnamed protein product [Caenorhabditis nigoni]
MFMIDDGIRHISLICGTAFVHESTTENEKPGNIDKTYEEEDRYTIMTTVNIRVSVIFLFYGYSRLQILFLFIVKDWMLKLMKNRYSFDFQSAVIIFKGNRIANGLGYFYENHYYCKSNILLLIIHHFICLY